MWIHPLLHEEIEHASIYELSDMWDQIEECLINGYYGRNHPSAMERSLEKIDILLQCQLVSSLCSFSSGNSGEDTDSSLGSSSEDDVPLSRSMSPRRRRGRGDRTRGGGSLGAAERTGTVDHAEIEEDAEDVDSASIVATTGVGESQGQGTGRGARPTRGRGRGYGRRRGRLGHGRR